MNAILKPIETDMPAKAANNTTTEAAHAGQGKKQFTEHTWGKPIYGAPTPVPCPFCGNEDLSIEHIQEAVYNRAQPHLESPDSYAVQCDQCCTEGPSCESAIQAAEAWNLRPGSAVSQSGPVAQSLTQERRFALELAVAVTDIVVLMAGTDGETGALFKEALSRAMYELRATKPAAVAS